MATNGQNHTLGIWMNERASRGTETGAPSGMPEDAFYRSLCEHGPECGLDVFLFDAASFRSASGLLDGYRLDGGRWRPDRFAPPDVVYDRTLCRNSVEKERRSAAIAEMKRRKTPILLGGALPGKRTVHAALKDDEELRGYLPPTFLLREGTLDRLARRYPNGLFLKPSCGTQGRGAAAFRPLPDGRLRIDGRSLANAPFSRFFGDRYAAFGWLMRFAGAAEYVVQPYLQLTGGDGSAFDIRALIQKDERGLWSFTGAAVRRGAPGSVTSNLHGGGTAACANGALAAQFGERRSAAMLAAIRAASERAALRLEQHFGRLAELGFDFGAEPDGRLWLLEANARPGREAFERDIGTYRLAALRTLRYAALLAARRSPLFDKTLKSPAFHAAT